MLHLQKLFTFFSSYLIFCWLISLLQTSAHISAPCFLFPTFEYFILSFQYLLPLSLCLFCLMSLSPSTFQSYPLYFVSQISVFIFRVSIVSVLSETLILYEIVPIDEADSHRRARSMWITHIVLLTIWVFENIFKVMNKLSSSFLYDWRCQ